VKSQGIGTGGVLRRGTSQPEDQEPHICAIYKILTTPATTGTHAPFLLFELRKVRGPLRFFLVLLQLICSDYLKKNALNLPRSFWIFAFKRI
jgi:hypothetical protein